VRRRVGARENLEEEEEWDGEDDLVDEEQGAEQHDAKEEANNADPPNWGLLARKGTPGRDGRYVPIKWGVEEPFGGHRKFPDGVNSSLVETDADVQRRALWKVPKVEEIINSTRFMVVEHFKSRTTILNPNPERDEKELSVLQAENAGEMVERATKIIQASGWGKSRLTAVYHHTHRNFARDIFMQLSDNGRRGIRARSGAPDPRSDPNAPKMLRRLPEALRNRKRVSEAKDQEIRLINGGQTWYQGGLKRGGKSGRYGPVLETNNKKKQKGS